MMNPAEYQVEQIQFFLLMLMRVSAMILVFPIFGSKNVPIQVKMGLSFFICLILFPLVQPAVLEVPNNLFAYAVLVVKEILVGLTIGFVSTLIFTGVSLAGYIIDHQAGFAMSRSMDPITESGATVIGAFKTMLFTIIFLAIHGHQFLILAMVKSFEKIPIMGVHFQTGPLALVFTKFIGAIFEIGIRLSAPVVALIMLVSMASGVLSRTIPQMNLFAVNMPAKIGIALIGVAVTLPFVYYVFEKAYENLQENIMSLLFLMT